MAGGTVVTTVGGVVAGAVHTTAAGMVTRGGDRGSIHTRRLYTTHRRLYTIHRRLRMGITQDADGGNG
jgi:hypothetical protein